MQVLFLGCGPGRFELEFLSRAPQLVSSSMALSAETTAEQDAAQAIFDSSFIPPTAQADDLRHSWLARGRASHELGSPDDAVPASVDQSSFGASKPQFGRPMPTTRQRNTMQAGQSSSTTMKLPCRIYFNSSVVVYQNCAVSSMLHTPHSAAICSANTARRLAYSHMHFRALFLGCSSPCSSSSQFCWSPSTFEEITVESLAFLRVMTPRPELVLLGTGNLIPGRIPDSIVAFMRELRIGVELMPSRSAIGTYNMLTNEGRTVMAALLHLVEEKTDPGQRPVRPSQRARQKLGYWNQEATNERKT